MTPVYVTVRCASCGNLKKDRGLVCELYRSQPIKGEHHRRNAEAKGRRVAREHSDAEPGHVVEFDPYFKEEL